MPAEEALNYAMPLVLMTFPTKHRKKSQTNWELGKDEEEEEQERDEEGETVAKAVPSAQLSVSQK